MSSTRAPAVAFSVFVALALPACSEASTTTVRAAPTVPSVTTVLPTTRPLSTEPASTTTTTTTTTLPPEPVGDAAALDALVDRIAEEAGIPVDEILIPDITQADPIAALKELLGFSDWAFSTEPHPALASIHTIEGSPAFILQSSGLEILHSNNRVGRHDAPFALTGFIEVDIDRMPMTDDERSTLPVDARAFQFHSAHEGLRYVDRATGEVAFTVPPDPNRIFLIVIAPTEVGWQEFWYHIVGQ